MCPSRLSLELKLDQGPVSKTADVRTKRGCRSMGLRHQPDVESTRPSSIESDEERVIRVEARRWKHEYFTSENA